MPSGISRLLDVICSWKVDMGGTETVRHVQVHQFHRLVNINNILRDEYLMSNIITYSAFNEQAYMI